MSEQRERKTSPGRKVAEFFTLGISLFVILGLTGFLVWQGLQPHPKFVAVEAHVLMDLIEKSGDQYIVPIEIVNKGNRTLRQIIAEVEVVEDGKPESREVSIDYLGQNSRQTVYVYFSKKPDEKSLKVTPTHYMLD